MHARRITGLITTPLLLAALLLPAGSAQAAITSGVSGDVLTVNGDGSDDTISVVCSSGNLLVNGFNPGTGGVTCASVDKVIVNAGAGDDTVQVNNFTDGIEINGSGGNDELSTGAAGVVNGGSGNDDLNGSFETDVLRGGTGNDLFLPFDGNDVVTGSKGTDKVYGYGQSEWTLTNGQLMGEGVDTLGSIEVAELEGASNDRMNASKFKGKAILEGEGGDDLLIGGSGNDVLLGSTGNDTLKGAGGNDRLNGGDDTDDCTGGPGKNKLIDCEP